jgi:hypothetical protein
VNHLVSRLSFGVVLLIESCGLARAQNPAVSLVHDAGSGSAASSPSFDLAQFPPTDVSVGADNSLALESFHSSTVVHAGNPAAFSPVAASAGVVPWPANPPAAQPAPEPPRRPYNSENPNKWQLGIAFALVRARSSVYYASAPGFNSSLAYWWKERIAIEGSVTTAFAPPVFENEHFRYLGYGAGPKVSFGHGRFEPWAHALVGGVHLIPQTAAGGRNGFEFTMGGGVDYVINDVISAKAAVDYLGTHMFGEWQNSAQILVGFSFRF